MSFISYVHYYTVGIIKHELSDETVSHHHTTVSGVSYKIHVKVEITL